MLLVLACLACCVAARAAPSSPRCLPESELDGYCQRRLDVDAQLASDEQTPTITGHVMEDSGINSISTAVKAWLENRTTAKKKYGHISTWDTSLVRTSTRAAKWSVNNPRRLRLRTFANSTIGTLGTRI